MNQLPFVFVAMPFGKQFTDEYALAIKPACEAAGGQCERVDEQIFAESILHRIYGEISRADVVIAELTDHNANVLYEVGYAHGLRKAVVLLTHSSEDIPFDLRHYPHVIHGGSLTTLRAQLERRLRWCFDNANEAAFVPPQPRRESLVDFFERTGSASDLDIQVAAKTDGQFVLYYSMPLRVHIKRIEYFVEEREVVFFSERNTRRSIGLPLGEELSNLIEGANEIHLVRLIPGRSTPESQTTVPFAVYRGPRTA